MSQTLLLAVMLGAIVVLIVYALYNFVLDTPARRGRIAKRLLVLADDYRAAVREDPSKADSSIKQLEENARSDNRFASCYAISVLASLAGEFPQGRHTRGVVKVIGQRLSSGDPFVRHAAAEALFLLGPVALGAADALQETKANYEQESSGLLAARALEKLNAATGH